ncbi:MAG: DNA primase [Spirochaetales bacterium]
MPRISSQTLDEINVKPDMVALVNEYTRLENRGGDYWGCCPFHNEKTPSFHIIPDRKMFHCFGCQAGGSLIQFYMQAEKVSFYDATHALAKRAGIKIVYDGNAVVETPDTDTRDAYIELYSRISGTYHFLLTSSESGKIALDYIKKRNLTDEIIELFQLGYAPSDRYWLKKFLSEKKYSSGFLAESGLFSKKYPDISFFSDRLIFPICNRHGQVVAFGGRILKGDGPKYLNSSDLVQYKKRETLYAFHLAKQYIRNEKKVIICEGYMDVIAYHQAQIKTAVAPLGTALTQEQVQLLRSFADTFYLSFDSDQAGQEATYKTILLCRKNNITVKVIQFEKGKDPAEILLNFGVKILTEYTENAIIDSEYLLSALMRRFSVSTPEGKTNICLAYFPYLDALQSDIYKESCFEHLCQTLNLRLETVKEDFKNREAAKGRLDYRQTDKTETKPKKLKLNTELRAVLAVTANFDFFPLMRKSLSVDDFEDNLARDMFITLEECFREDAVSSDSILSRCPEYIRSMVTQTITSGEFSQNSQQVIEDSIKMIKRKSLIKKRDRLLNRIRQMQSGSFEEQQQLDTLLSEKMNIDFELNNL